LPQKFSLRYPRHEVSRPLFVVKDWTFDESLDAPHSWILTSNVTAIEFSHSTLLDWPSFGICFKTTLFGFHLLSALGITYNPKSFTLKVICHAWHASLRNRSSAPYKSHVRLRAKERGGRLRRRDCPMLAGHQECTEQVFLQLMLIPPRGCLPFVPHML